MVDDASLRKLIDEDLLRIKFILKNKVASLEEIKQEEERLVEGVKKVMAALRELEHVLEKEIEMYRRMQGGWEKAYAERRWSAIGRAIQEEIDFFNREYGQTKSAFDTFIQLASRIQHINDLLKTLNARNKDAREEELKILETFRTQKQTMR